MRTRSVSNIHFERTETRSRGNLADFEKAPGKLNRATMEIDTSAWDSIDFTSLGPCVAVVGDCDAGKSTFVRFASVLSACNLN